MRKLVELYGLTAADLGLGEVRQPARRRAPARTAAAKAPRKRAVPGGAGEPRYRDPKSGRTWNGKGRTSQWIAAAKDREALRIDAGEGQEKPDVARAGAAPARKGGEGSDKPATRAAGKTVARTAARHTAHGKAARKATPAQGAAPRKRPAARKQRAAAAAQAPAAAVPPGEPPVPEPPLDSFEATPAAAAAADGAATA